MKWNNDPPIVGIPEEDTPKKTHLGMIKNMKDTF